MTKDWDTEGDVALGGGQHRISWTEFKMAGVEHVTGFCVEQEPS